LLVDRSNGTIDFDVPVEAMLTVNAESWEAEECPLCKQNIPLTKPGRSDK
jgi:orotate phosphoribosyltransferase